MSSVINGGFDNPAFEPDSLEPAGHDSPRLGNTGTSPKESDDAMKVDYDRANRNAQNYYDIVGDGDVAGLSSSCLVQCNSVEGQLVGASAPLVEISGSTEGLSDDGSWRERSLISTLNKHLADVMRKTKYSRDELAMDAITQWDGEVDWHDLFNPEGDCVESGPHVRAASSVASTESGIGTSIDGSEPTKWVYTGGSEPAKGVYIDGSDPTKRVYADGSQPTKWVYTKSPKSKSTRSTAMQTPVSTGLRPLVLPSSTQVQRHRRIGMALGALTGAVAFAVIGGCAALALGASLALTAPVMLAIVGASALVGSLAMGLVGARIGGATQADRVYKYLMEASDEEVIGWYCTDPHGAGEAADVPKIETLDERGNLLRLWLVALSRTPEFLADHEGLRVSLRPILLDAAKDMNKLAKLSEWLEEGLSPRRDEPHHLSERIAGLARGRIDGVEAYSLYDGFVMKAEKAVLDALFEEQLALKNLDQSLSV